MKALLLIILFLYLLLASLITYSQKPELVVPIGHTNWVKSVAFSPNGRYAISCGDNILKLWEVSTGKLLRNFGRHNGWVDFVLFSPDGNYVLSMNFDTEFKLWDVKTGKLVRRFKTPSTFVHSVSFSPDGNYILSGHDDNTLKLWKASTGKLLRIFKGHTNWVTAVAFSPDNRFALSGSIDKTTKLWDITTGKPIRSLKKHTDWVESVAFSPDGVYALSGSRDEMVNLWKVSSGKLVRQFKGQHIRAEETGYPNIVFSVCFSPNSRYALSGSWDGTVNLWDISTGEKLRSFTGHTKAVNSVTFSPDGHYILSGSDDKTLRLWDVESGKMVRQFEGHAKQISAGAFFTNSPHFLLGTGDNTIHFWDMGTGHPIRRLVGQPRQLEQGYSGWVNQIVISPDGRQLLSTSFDVATVWDVSTGKQLRQLKGHAGNFNSIIFSSDSRFALSGSADSTLILWNVGTGQLIRQFKGHADGIIEVALSPDGRYALSGDGNGIIILWDARTGEQLRKWESQIKFCHSVAFSPDSRFVLLGAAWDDKKLTLWEVSTGKLVRQFEGLPTLEDLTTLTSFSPDGRLAFSNDDDANLDLWDVSSGKRLYQLKGHTEDMNSVTFSPDGRFILSCSADNTTKLWSVATGKELATLVVIDSTDWVVTTPAGLFDASPGAMNLMHYVVNDYTDQDEPWKVIELNQLKQRYYQPGLLPILMGFSKEPLRQVPAFEGVNLPPGIQLSIESAILTVKIKNHRGGIGRVAIFINGAEVVDDLRANPQRDVNQNALTLTLPLARFANHYDTLNTIRVVAANGANWLNSRPAEISYRPAITTRGGIAEQSSSGVRKTVRLRAVVVGTSNAGLRFAHTDAEQIANGLQWAATELLGPTNVSVQRLVTKPGAPPQSTKADIVKALEAAQQTHPEDIFVLHLSGHAINYGGQDGDLYYLTAGATSADASYLNDPAIRQTYALSSQELTRYLNLIPARKKLLILDVCAAGKGAEKLLVAARDIPASQIRALDRLQERTGFYVLAGSAADAVSYEASVYGQGLLTYALLKGLRGAALRREGSEEFVDVEKWLGYAVEQVPLLAKGIGGIQQPFYRGTQNQRSFDVGRVTKEVKAKIRISEPKPVLLVKSFQEETQFDDVLDLKNKVESALNDLIATRGADAPVLTMDAKDYPGAYSLSGRYTLQDEGVSVSCKVFRAAVPVGEFVVTGTKSKLSDLAQLVLTRAQRLVKP